MSKKEVLGEQRLLESILSDNLRLRNEALELIYHENFFLIKKLVLKNNGSLEEAEDVFQEGVEVLYRNLIRGKFKGDSTINTYVYAICKNIWWQKLRRNRLPGETILELEVSDESEDESLDIPLLNRLLDKLGEDCKRILEAFYYEGKSMSDIRELFHLKNDQSAKTKKYRCMKHLMTIIDREGLTLSSFMTNE